MKKQIEYRVRAEIDPNARFEECNGEARPLTAEEYAENEYYACRLHPRAGSKTVAPSRNGKPPVGGCATCGNTKYEPIPYEEYLAWYGDPDRHTYVRLTVQKRCPCCNRWDSMGGLGEIDFMENDPTLRFLDEWLTPDQVTELGEAGLGYLYECMTEDLAEAGWKAPKRRQVPA